MGSDPITPLQKVGGDAKKIGAGGVGLDEVAFGALTPEENELLIVIEQKRGDATDGHAFRNGCRSESRFPEFISWPERGVVQNSSEVIHGNRNFGEFERIQHEQPTRL